MMVYTLLADGFEEIEAFAVVDILRRANIEVKTVSVCDCKSVKGAHGIETVADDTINTLADFDVLFLPGGYPGYVNLESNPYVISLIQKANKENKIIAAICAAPSILGKLGLLSGKKACCFPSFEQYLEGAENVTDDVCVDGNIVTSRGAGTAHKLAFELVAILKNPSCALELKQNMLYSD